jgi:hypothetical protein
LAGLVSIPVSPMTSECDTRQYIRKSGSRAAYVFLAILPSCHPTLRVIFHDPADFLFAWHAAIVGSFVRLINTVFLRRLQMNRAIVLLFRSIRRFAMPPLCGGFTVGCNRSQSPATRA